MNSEVNTLQNLKISLEHDQGSDLSFLAILEKHYDYLAESLSVLLNGNSSKEDQQLHLIRLVHVLNMHFRAKEEVVYPTLMHADHKELRLQTHVCQQEAALAFQLIDEIKAGAASNFWSEPLDAKTKVMASILKSHLSEEARVLFPLGKKFLPPSVLENMSEPYLTKCVQYLSFALTNSSFPEEFNQEGFYLPGAFRPIPKVEVDLLRH